VLELRGLKRSYGDVVALDDVSFTVRKGQMFGFIGPNGAGKTTAMRIILGVLEPDAGEVLWRSRPMDDEARRRVGYMPEDHGQTFFLTVRIRSLPMAYH
jgi:ABC-2 type transport system ATP-binding protein